MFDSNRKGTISLEFEAGVCHARGARLLHCDAMTGLSKDSCLKELGQLIRRQVVQRQKVILADIAYSQKEEGPVSYTHLTLPTN